MTMSMARPLKFNPLHAFAVVILSTKWEYATAFQTQAAQGAIGLPTKSIVRLSNQDKIDAMFGPRVDDGEDEVLFSDTERGRDSWGAPSTEDSHQVKKKKSMTRWGSLNPKVKARIVKEAQERAIRNKKKREPAADKKRRLYMQYKEMEKQSKREKFVIRETPISSPARISLSSFNPGDSLKGRVISLTNFGAYVDVGSEVDGLLHVSQITRDEFVSHPRQFLSPGMEVDVRVVRVSKELKKLQLTMLPEEILEEENVFNKFDIDEDEDDRIQLDEIEVDDELWGEIRRVTDYGAYVELGAVVRGFLHFMDHPLFGDLNGAKPNEIMAVGDRVRVWVMDVDTTQKRIKLTANRPPGLPGPRREIQWV